MNKFERSETLQGLFWPKYYKDFEDIVNLEFDFKRGDKVTIYREFIHAIKKGWVRVEQRVVVRYLAEQSNLADGDTLNRRINAIRQGFKRYKNNYL